MRFFFFTILVLLFACKEKVKTVEDTKLYDEVMVIHDKVMPETNTIHNYKTRLKQLQNDGNKDFILNQISSLEAADDAMMIWMSKFDVPKEDSLKTKYLVKEKIKIQAVSDTMFAAIANAKHVVDSMLMFKK